MRFVDNAGGHVFAVMHAPSMTPGGPGGPLVSVHRGQPFQPSAMKIEPQSESSPLADACVPHFPCNRVHIPVREMAPPSIGGAAPSPILKEFAANVPWKRKALVNARDCNEPSGDLVRLLRHYQWRLHATGENPLVSRPTLRSLNIFLKSPISA